MSIGTLFENAVSRHPHKTFFIFKDREFTYEAFLDAVKRVANGFLSLGVKKGDKVAIMLPNGFEFPCCWLAANMVGAVMVPVNGRFVANEMAYVFNHSEARVLVTSRDFLETVRSIKKDLALLDKVIVTDTRPGGDEISLSGLLESDVDLRIEDVGEDDLAAILYTSGTTGNPKGCLVDHYYFLNIGETMGKWFRIRDEDRVLTAQPFYYMDPQWNTVMVMTYGATLVLAEKFSPSRFWDEVRRYGITWFCCIGSMTSFLYNMPSSELDACHNLRMVMTSGIPPAIHEAWEKRFNVPVYEGYGSTETGGDITVPLYGDRKVGTACIGQPMTPREAKIVDDEDTEVADGEPGEIVLRRVRGMMRGYYKDPETTHRVFRGGWFHTGDLGYRDGDGDFHYVGRKKDIIRRGGENISAASIEQVLMLHPSIMDAAVIPVPDLIRGEEVKAYVVLKENAELSYQELVRFCEQNMASFKVPRYYEFRKSLPKTPSERVQSKNLRKRVKISSKVHSIGWSRRIRNQRH